MHIHSRASLWRKTSDRSLESHDAAELVGGMCHGSGCRKKKHPPPGYIVHKDGIELSHLESSALLGTGLIPSREQSTVCW